MLNDTMNRAAIAAASGRRPPRNGLSRRIASTLGAAMLAGTALVPASAQTFDVNGTLVSVTNFVDPPVNGANIILNENSATLGTFRVVNGGPLSFGGNLTNGTDPVTPGILAFSKSGAGALTLSGNNTYSGGATIAQGTLIAGSTTALSSFSNLAISPGATVDLGGFNNSVLGLTGGGTLTNSAPTAASLTLNPGTVSTFNGSITGNMGLVKTGTGTQALSAASSFSNGVELQQGVLRVGNNTALGTGVLSVTGNATLNNLNAANALVLDNDVNISNGVQLLINPANPPGGGAVFTLAGAISGGGGIVKQSSNTLALTGNNSFAGGVTLTAGRLEVGSNTALGSGILTVNGGATLAQSLGTTSITISNAIAGSQPLTIATPDAGQVFTLAGDIVTNRDIIILGGGGGDVALTGNNNLGGAAVRVRTGTLAVDSSNALGNAGSLRFGDGAGLALDGDAVFGFTVLTQGGGVPTVATIDTRGNNGEFSGRVADGGVGDTLGLIKTGTGTLTLSRPNSSAGTQNILSGGLVINQGTVAVTGRLEAVTTVNAGGALSASGAVIGAVAVNGDGQLAVDGQVTGNVSFAGNGTLAGAGQITGDVSFVDGAASVLSAGNSSVANSVGQLTITGNLDLGTQTQLNFDLGAPGAGDLVVVTGTLDLGGVINVTARPGFTVGTHQLFSAGSLLNFGSVTLGARPAGYIYNLGSTATSLFLDVSLADFYWDGGGTQGDGIASGQSGLWNTALNNWTNDLGTAVTPYVSDAGLSRVFFTTQGGTVTLDSAIAFNRLFFQVDGYSINGNGNALNFDAGTIEVTNGGDRATINADLNGVDGLTKAGPGILRLTGNNSYTGGTVVDGRIEVASDTALGAAAGAVQLNNGAELASVINAVTLANNIVLDGNNTIATLSDLTLTGTVSGAGALNKTGAGTLTLTGANSFGGDVDIGAGSLVARTAAALGNGIEITAAGGTSLAIGPAAPAGAVEVLGKAISIASGGTLTLDLLGTPGSFAVDEDTGTALFDGTDLTLGGTLSGGTLSITGGGQVRLQTSNALEGVSIDRSSVVLENAQGLGSGTLTVNEAALYAVSGAAVTLAQNITVSNLFYIAGTDAITLDGTVSSLGSAPGELGAIVKLGSNSLRLNGANSLDAVRLVNGRLILGNSQALGLNDFSTADVAGTSRTLEAGVDGLQIANNLAVVGPLSIDTGANTFTVNGQVYDSGSIVKLGSGNLVLAGNNIYSGGTQVDAGTLTAGSDTAFGSGLVTMANGTLLTNSVAGPGPRTIGNNFNLGNMTISSAGNTFVLSGVLQGAGTVVKDGQGTLRLTGNSSNVATGFTGTFDVQQGVLEVDGQIAGNVTVQIGAALAGTGTIFGTTEVLGSAIIAPGNSPGTLTVGSLLLNASSVLNFELGRPNVVGNALNDRINVLNAGGLRLAGTLNVTETTGTTFGNGIYNLITYAGGLDPASTGLTIGSLPGAFNGVVQTVIPGQVNLVVTSPGTLILYWDSTDTLGNGAVDPGAGTWSISGTNWTGVPDSQLNTTWFDGALAVFTGTGGTVTLDGSFQAAGLQFTSNGYTLVSDPVNGGGLNIGAGGTFISTSNAVTATISALIAGTGILAKQGNGTLILDGANTFSGGTDVQGGTLQLNTATAAGSGGITLAGGTTLANGGGTLAITNAITTLGAANIDSGAGQFTLDGVVDGAGALIKLGSGTLVLNGANLYAGGTALLSGSIQIGTNSALGTGALTLSGGTSLVSGAADLAVANAITTLGSGTVDSGATSLTLSGIIDGAGSIVKIGSGTLVLTGANLYSGGTALTAGTIEVGSNTALGTGALTMTGGTTLQSGAPALVLGNAIATLGIGTIDTAANSLTLGGVISGAGSIVKIGSGTLVLNGANSFTAGFSADAGTVQVGNNSALGAAAASFADATTLLAGSNGLDLANDITLVGSVNVDTAANDFTLSGDIGGLLLRKLGSGNLILNGDNGFLGATLLEGTVTLGTNSALGAGQVDVDGPVTVAAGVDGLTIGNVFVLNDSTEFRTGFFDTTTYTGPISGAAALTLVGGTIVLNGANSHAGGTVVTDNTTVTVGSNTALGTGQVSMGDFSTLATVTNGLTLANNIASNGSVAVFDIGANTLTLNGIVSGAGGIAQFGTGNLILNGANTYAGGSQIEGTVTLGTSSALGTGSVLMGQDSTLTVNADNLVVANAFSIGGNTTVATGGFTLSLNGNITADPSLVIPGSLVKTGSGTLILSGNNSYGGGTQLTEGTIQVRSGTAFGTGALTMSDATTLAAGVDGLTLQTGVITLLGAGVVDTQGFTFTLNSDIGGAGSLTKIGSGNLILTAGSYSGGSFINEGTVTISQDLALGTGLVTMADGTTLVGTNAFTLALANNFSIGNVTITSDVASSFELAGVIGGSGLLTKDGVSPLILSGANSYSGGTALAVGVIDIRTNSALGTGTLTMSDATTLLAGSNGLVVANAIATPGTAVIDTQANQLRLDGVISGAGGIVKSGSGNLILAGTNSYAGGTNLSEGTLTITNNGSIGTGALTTADSTALVVGTATGANTAITLANAVSLGLGLTSVNLQGNTLVFNNDATIVTNGASLTLNGIVSGDGGLVTGNFGTLTLNGANSYGGGTQITSRSVVYVGSDTAVGTGTVTMNGATGLYNFSGATRTLANAFVLNGGSWLGGSSDLVLNGGISGAGFVIKAGAQTLVLNGANSHSGTNQLRDGRITVGTSSALGTGALRVFAPVAAPVAGLATTLSAGTTGLALANAVTLDSGSNLIVESGGGSFTLNGVISGAGALTKVQAGNLVLNAANSYSGGTTVSAGTVTVGNNSALGTGAVALASGTTLANNTDNLVVGNAFTIGNAEVATGANVFTLAGVIGGTGLLTKTGSGTLVLNGANSYSGGTSVAAGTVTVGTSSALGTGAVAMANGTTLANNANNLALANGFVIGNVDVATGANVFTLDGVIAGAGLLTKTGSGTLVLNGASSFTGGTALNAGTIRVGNNTALGTAGLAMAAGTTLQAGAAGLSLANAIALAGGATVDNNGRTLTLGGVISGTGLLAVIDSAAVAGSTLVLAGANSYTGGTLVTGTALQVESDANLGNAAGGITLTGGTLRTTASFTTARTVALAGAGGTLDTATGTSLTSTGVISGTALTKAGAGTLVLNGANTHTGGTALNAGQITVGTNAALGTGALTMAGGTTLQAGVTALTTANAIVTLGAATINSGATPATYTLSGVISGAGSVTKQGTGILNLTGASSYTGATTVAAGTLNVTGSLVSAVTVNSGAALTGTGTVGALSVLAGGSVSPGAPGSTDRATLTVTGAAALAGTYTVNVTAAGSDRIAAGGALSLGGTLAVVPGVPGTFGTFNQTFTVASGASRTGTFATVSGLDQFGVAFAPSVEYSSTAATIRLAPQSLFTLGNRFGGITGNALEVANAFDRAVAGGYNPQAFFNVYANGGNDLPRTLRQMSGEQRATERRVVLDTSRTIREAALDRLNNGIASMGGQQVSSNDGDKSITFWLRGAGSWAKAQTNGAATEFTSEQRGVLTGLDWKMNGLTLGGMFHYTSTDIEYRVLGGSSSVETVGGTLYAGYRKDGGVVANAGATVAGSRSNGARTISLASFQQSLQGRTNGTTYQIFGELAWDLAGAADTRIEPFARVSFVKADFGALTETGGVAALTAAKQSSDITVTNLGMRFGANVAQGKVALNASASWQGTTGDRSALTVIGIPAVGQNGNIRSVLIDRKALNVTADVGVNLSDTVRFSLGYSALVGQRNDDHGGRATLNFAF